LTQALVKSGVVLVPTLFVLHPAMASSDPIFDGRRLLDDPSMRYVPDEVLAEWRTGSPPGAEGPAHLEKSYQRLMELMARFHRAGVPIFAGTDAVLDAETRWTTPGFTLHDELVLLVELGMTPAEALAAATFRPAEFLGLEDVGTIEAGSAADLVLLTANPLEDIRNTRNVSLVVSNGELFDRAALDRLLAQSEPPPSP
jgi:imidazolonepropionase-like amidohydrolase